MPREGPAYPISNKWRERVREAIDDFKDDDGKAISDAAFARKAGIAKSSLNAALKPDSVQSTVMPEINKTLGWPAPRVLSTPDDLELWALFDAMSEFEQGRAIERARSTVERLKTEAARRRRS